MGGPPGMGPGIWGPPGPRRRRNKYFDDDDIKIPRAIAKVQRRIHMQVLTDKQACAAAFWKDVHDQGFSNALDIDPGFVAYHLSRTKQILFDGHWYVKKTHPRRVLRVVNDIVIESGRAPENIFFKSRWRGYRLQFNRSNTKGMVNDIICWADDLTSIKWSRYTNLMKLSELVEKMYNLQIPRYLKDIIREYLGRKDYNGQKKELKQENRKRRKEIQEMEDSVISEKRRQHIEIFLRARRIQSVQDMRDFIQCIEKMDISALSSRWGVLHIDDLAYSFPTDEELAALNGLCGIGKDASFALRWINEASRMPNSRDLVHIWGYLSSTFRLDKDIVENVIRMHHTALMTVRSDSFKKFCGLTLKIINHVDTRRKRRYLHGFRLDSMRAFSPPVLKFLVLEAYENHPDALLWVEEFTTMFEAGEIWVDLDDSENQICDVYGKLQEMDQTLTRITATSPDSPLNRAITESIDSAKKQWADVKDAMVDLRIEYEENNRLFGGGFSLNSRSRVDWSTGIWSSLYDVTHDVSNVIRSIKHEEHQQKLRLRQYINKQKQKEARRERRRREREEQKVGTEEVKSEKKKRFRRRKSKETDSLQETIREMQKIKQNLKHTKTRQRKIFVTLGQEESTPSSDKKQERAL